MIAGQFAAFLALAEELNVEYKCSFSRTDLGSPELEVDGVEH